MAHVGILTDGAWPQPPAAPSAVNSVTKGNLQVEDGFQLLSIPVEFGYWDITTHQHIHDGVTRANIKNYVMDQIEDKTGLAANTQVEFANTYPGDLGVFRTYVPGVTNGLSTNNFELVYYDVSGAITRKEPMGFWIKTVTGASFTLEWGF